MADHETTLDQVIREHSATDETPMRPISHDLVMRWMADPDIEALGATYSLITEKRHARRIEPALTFEECQAFVVRSYERCFLESPDGEWSDSRYSAGWDLVNWFARLWRDPDVPRDALVDLKAWLARLYREADQELRTCIETATLEHLFETPEFRSFFADWASDPVLAAAHEAAMKWVRGGGHSPLGRA